MVKVSVFPILVASLAAAAPLSHSVETSNQVSRELQARRSPQVQVQVGGKRDLQGDLESRQPLPPIRVQVGGREVEELKAREPKRASFKVKFGNKKGGKGGEQVESREPKLPPLSVQVGGREVEELETRRGGGPNLQVSIGGRELHTRKLPSLQFQVGGKRDLNGDLESREPLPPIRIQVGGREVEELEGREPKRASVKVKFGSKKDRKGAGEQVESREPKFTIQVGGRDVEENEAREPLLPTSLNPLKWFKNN